MLISPELFRNNPSTLAPQTSSTLQSLGARPTVIIFGRRVTAENTISSRTQLPSMGIEEGCAEVISLIDDEMNPANDDVSTTMEPRTDALANLET